MLRFLSTQCHCKYQWAKAWQPAQRISDFQCSCLACGIHLTSNRIFWKTPICCLGFGHLVDSIRAIEASSETNSKLSAQSCASRAARRWCSCHVATWLEFEELPVSFVSVIDCQHSEALFDGCRMDKRVWQKQEFQHCQKMPKAFSIWCQNPLRNYSICNARVASSQYQYGRLEISNISPTFIKLHGGIHCHRAVYVRLHCET